MKTWLFPILMASALTAAAVAQPTTFTYQGRLKNGLQLAAGLHDFRFRLFDAALGGAQLGPTLCANNIAVVDGFFTTTIDFGQQFATTAERHLEIDVRADTGLDCQSSAGFTTLGPRQLITASPHSLFAQAADSASQLNGQPPSFYTNAGNLTGTLPSGLLTGTYPGALTLNNAGNSIAGSGAGLMNVNADKLDGLDSTAFLQSIPAPLTLSGTNATHIIRGVNASTDPEAAGVFGESTAGPGFTPGVYGKTSSGQGPGVYGVATHATGTTYGVLGTSQSTSGVGVQGQATANSGTTYGGVFSNLSTSSGVGGSGGGVWGRAVGFQSAQVTHGVRGESNSTQGRGVFGEATATTGGTYGVYGETHSPNGRAVYGSAIGTSGITTGVYGQTFSPAGRGVFGSSGSSGESTGVLGQTTSPNGYGVYGYASSPSSGFGYGVWGESNSPSGAGVVGQANHQNGVNYGGYFYSESIHGRGVYGIATHSTGGGGIKGVEGQTLDPNGWAVFAQGRFGATGTKAFVIDHPLDPENKYLLHYCTEAPEPLNAYSGNVVTDATGYATVSLPEYFHEINKDFRYQLTVLDDGEKAQFVLVKVVREINEGAFTLRTSAPHIKVSWRVEATRNDRWVQQYGAPVESEKQGTERGKYQRPELYGMPQEMGMYHHLDAAMKKKSVPLETRP